MTLHRVPPVMSMPVRTGVHQLPPIWEPKSIPPSTDGSPHEDCDIDTTMTESEHLVLACGRTVSLEMHKLCTMADLKAELQSTFQTEGLAFTIFDSTGAPLTNDAQLQQAVEQGRTPLGATLPDEPFLNGDETPHIQCRLLRDQLQSATDKIASLERQVSSLRQEMEVCAQQQHQLADGLRNGGCMSSTNSEQQITTEASERVAALGEQLHWLRDAFEQLNAEKTAHGQEISVQMAAMEDVRAELDLEKRTREALEGQCAACTRALEEQLHAASAYHGDMLREHVEAFKNVTHEGLQQLAQEVLQVRSNTEAAASLVSARLADMEERCASLESRMLEARTESAGVDRGRESDGLQSGTSVARSGVSVCVPVGFSDSRDKQPLLQEHWLCDSRKRLTHQAWQADQARQMSDLERKLNERKERDLEGFCSWSRTPVTAAVNTPRAGHGTSSPLRVRPQLSTIDLTSGLTAVANGSPLRARPTVQSLEAPGGSSPLRLRPTASAEASGGASPMCIRGPPIEAPAPVVAPPPGNSSPVRPRFTMGNILGAGNPAAAACVAGALATPRGNPAAAGPQPRGRAVASAASLPCASTVPGAAEVRKQSLSPVRQMLLITQKSLGAGSFARS
mmetsp:Transcript_84507/g.204917  ORF Transcript_84507/g.204917 Transcript_84507/m.204917 type:complete len:623 (+) Transcript_84507:3-1871(+)